MLYFSSVGKTPQLSDERALHVINSNYQREDITPQHSFPIQPAPRVNTLPRTPSHGIAIVAPTTASKNSSNATGSAGGSSQEQSRSTAGSGGGGASQEVTPYPVCSGDFSKDISSLSSGKLHDSLIPQLVHDETSRTSHASTSGSKHVSIMSNDLSHLSQPMSQAAASTPGPGPVFEQPVSMSQYHRSSVDRNVEGSNAAVNHQSGHSPHEPLQPQQISPQNSRVPMNLSNHRHSLDEDLSNYSVSQHRKQSSNSQNSPHLLPSRQESVASSQHHMSSHSVSVSQLSRHDTSTPLLSRHDSITNVDVSQQQSPPINHSHHDLASTVGHMLEKSSQLRYASKPLVEPPPLLNPDAFTHQAAQEYLNHQQNLLNLSRARAGLSLEQQMTLERLRSEAILSKQYNDRFITERLMMSSPAGTELLAQQYHAAISAAASLPSQPTFDTPQDFSMNRLSHNFDPGVS